VTLRKTLLLLAAATCITLPSCSGGGSNTSTVDSNDVAAFGTLSLSGPDTADIGNTLTVGDLALLLGPGTVETYFLVDELTTVSGFEYSVTSGIFDNAVSGDPLNTFVINVIDATDAGGFVGISMAIRVMGIDFDYSCTSCAGLTIDAVARTIDFDNVEVIGQGNATGNLVLDGMIGWTL
jgi:hypothetical protein